MSATSGNRRRYTNVLCCSLMIPPSSRGRSLSIVESDGVNRSMCTPPPTSPNPHPLSGFCIGKYSKWSWNGGFSFLLQVSLFLQFERIIPALQCLRRAGVALYEQTRGKNQECQTEGIIPMNDSKRLFLWYRSKSATPQIPTKSGWGNSPKAVGRLAPLARPGASNLALGTSDSGPPPPFKDVFTQCSQPAPQAIPPCTPQ